MKLYRQLLPYGVAIASTTIALLLTLWFEPWMSRTVGAFFYIAIISSTWYGGIRPGIISIALSLLAINYYFIPPLRQFWGTAPDDLIRLGIFSAVALIINLLSSNLRESKRKVETLSYRLQKESRDRLRVALSAAQMGMWDWNLVTGEISWSPEHEQLFGLPPGSFDDRYETFDACLHPDDRIGVNQAIAASLVEGIPYQHEYRVVWKDGSIHWVEGRGQVFYNEAGQAVRMSGTIMTIDERKQSQLLLQQQIDQQRLVLEITNRIRQSLNLQEILQTTVDEVRQFLQVDRVIIFQFAPGWGGTVTVESVVDEALAILPFDIYDPCIGSTYVDPFQQGLVTAKADIYTADISPCHVEFLAQFQVRANLVVPILKQGKLWGLLAAHHCSAPRPWQAAEIDLLRQIASQVSIALQQAELFEQVQTELVERRQAEESLRQSEVRLHLAQNASQSGVWDWDILTNTLTWSPEYYQLYGLDPGVEANYETWLGCIHPDDREQASQKTLQALEDGSSELRVEFRVMRSGELRWFAGIGQVLRNETGKLIRLIGLTIDITPQKQTELALQKLNIELEKRVAERTTELTKVNDRLLEALAEQQHTQMHLLEQAQLLDLAQDTIMTRDLNSVITFWNQGAERTYGWAKDEALGQVSHTLLKTQFPQSLDKIQATLLEKGYWEGELVHFSRDDCPLTVASRWVLQKDQLGRPIKILEINNDITAHKQAEQTLALQAVITRSMAEGICLVRADDATIIYANPKFERLFGYRPGELDGQPVSIVNYATEAGSAEAVNQSIRSAVFQSGEATYEVQNVKKDGTPFWCSATCSVFRHPNYGDVLVAVHQDITDRKQAEAALQQQTRLEQLCWNITQSIRQLLDLHAILNTALTQMRQTLQVDRVAVYRFQPDWSGNFIAESVNQDWIKLVDSGFQRVVEDTYLQETQGGRFQHRQTFMVSDIYTAELQPCHIQLLEQFQAKAYAVAPIFSGETLWGLLAIYQNATARDWQTWEIELLEQVASQLAIAIQQSELYSQLQLELQERKQAAAVLREAERRWRSLLDNVQLIVVGLDQTGHVNYVNPFFLSLTGFIHTEVVGKNWFESFLPPAYQTSIQGVFSEVLNHNAYPYYHNAILTKSGEERFIAWNNTMLQDVDGNTIGTISIGEDVTERQKVEKMKNEFISIVSHELRTPLTSIRGSLGLLATGVMDDEPGEMKRMIEIAAIDTERLVRLVNDVLDLEKLESGKVSLMRSWCNAADLMQRSLEVMQASAQEAGIQIVVHPLSIQLWVDPDRIIQTLTNLLSNAIKFSPPGGTVTLSIEVRSQESGTKNQSTKELELSDVRFSIHDQGRGIPADKLESIFGRFQQVDASDSRDRGGTGLGLAICRSIVQQHEGQIWVESSWGHGSTFFFTLPLQTK